MLGSRQTMWRSGSEAVQPSSVVHSLYSVGWQNDSIKNPDGSTGNFAKTVVSCGDFDVKAGCTILQHVKRANSTSSPGYFAYFGTATDWDGTWNDAPMLGHGKYSFSYGVGSYTFIDPGNYFVFDVDNSSGGYGAMSGASTDGDWHHWAVTVEGNVATVYRDGTKIGSSTNGMSQAKPCNRFFLLGRPNTYNSSSSQTRNLNGYVTRVAILDRVASVQEIADDCALGMENPQLDGIAHYWDMELDGSGLVPDRVGDWDLELGKGLSQSADVPSAQS